MIAAHRATLATLRAAALAGLADTYNPLTTERTATGRLTARTRSDLYSQALAEGFRTFRGVGVSSRPGPMTLGAVPETDRAESLEIGTTVVVYRLVELTEAGKAARDDREHQARADQGQDAREIRRADYDHYLHHQDTE